MTNDQSYFKAYLESSESKINYMIKALSGMESDLWKIPTNGGIDVETVLRIKHKYELLAESLNSCKDSFESARLKENLK